MTDVRVKLKWVPMASTGTLINKVGLISRSTVSTEGQEEAHHAGFWYRNCKRFFFFLSFFFFFSWWVSDLYTSCRMTFKWLHVYVCLWSTLFRTGWKVEIFRMRCVAFIVRWAGSPLTSSEPVKLTGPTFSARALTWGEQTDKRLNQELQKER